MLAARLPRRGRWWLTAAEVFQGLQCIAHLRIEIHDDRVRHGEIETRRAGSRRRAGAGVDRRLTADECDGPLGQLGTSPLHDDRDQDVIHEEAEEPLPGAAPMQRSVDSAGAAVLQLEPPTLIRATLARPTVLVLGGAGFVGRALVKRLRHDGLAVRALVRSTTSRAELLAREGVELVQGDFADPRCVEAALEGIQHVYHLARGSGSSWAECLLLDVEPTRRLAAACLARGVWLYYTSSIAIYAGGRSGDVVTESTPPSPQAMRISLYARTKVASEQLLARMHIERGLNVVVFRPGIVIGAGGTALHPGLGTWPSASLCHPWGDGRNGLPFVLVEDCADAMARALHTAGIAGQTFNLVGEPCVTGNGYLDALERVVGIPIERVRRPTWWLFARSAAKWGLQVLARNPERRMPSYRYIDGLSCRAHYKPDLARQRLGWAPTADAATLIERGIVAPVPGSSA